MTGRVGNVGGKFGRRYAGGLRRRVRRWAVAFACIFDRQTSQPVGRLYSAEAPGGFTAAELRDILDSVIEVDAQPTANRRSAMLPEEALPRPSSGSSNISCRQEKTGQLLGDPRSDPHSASTHSDPVPALEVCAAGRSGTDPAFKRIHESLGS
jgi:hypothetical protein